MLHDPKCRFDYPLAPIRLHHADLFSLDCPSRTPPINTKLKTTFKGSKHQTKSLPRSKLYFPIVRKIHSSIYHTTLDFQGAGAPSLLSSHSPHISYDRRSLSNVPEHRLKPATNTTTKQPCSSGREPDGRDQFLSRPQSFD
ncbi:unnamed protein product [Prunus brigantina]